MPGKSYLVTALLASIICAPAAESLLATIPIKLNRGRIILTANINERGPFNFLLDTACTIPTLHPTLADELELEASGRVRIQGIAGVERAPTFRNVVFDLGKAAYKPRRVASIPSERGQSRRRDGVIGSGFFETFVVEFLPANKVLKLHTTTNFQHSGKGDVVSMRFREEIPVVEASIDVGGKTLKGEFEIDTGCDSGVCLGEHFVKEHGLVEKLGGKNSEKFGIGGSVDTTDARIPVLRLGTREIKNVQSDLFLDGSPVDAPLAGHIGMGVFGEMQVIFDYSGKRLILR